MSSKPPGTRPKLKKRSPSLQSILEKALSNGSLEAHLSKLGFVKNGDAKQTTAQNSSGSNARPQAQQKQAEQHIPLARSVSFAGNGWAKSASQDTIKKARLAEKRDDQAAVVKEGLVADGWNVPVTTYGELFKNEASGICTASKAQAISALVEFANASASLAVLAPTPIKLADGGEANKIYVPFKDVSNNRITIRARYVVPVGLGPTPLFKSDAPVVKVEAEKGDSITIALT